ncbi:unnamed protein product [Effrenium voratum]|uniref:Uncharacterized protein n=1 Tax=Effrenium voratum TaxID=2562239 RepID=A0AA36HLJ0_9DINO|nr:unnamed protein product [Effrenium voratum]
MHCADQPAGYCADASPGRRELRGDGGATRRSQCLRAAAFRVVSSSLRHGGVDLLGRSAAVFQTSANIISVVYMLLLFCCIYTAGVTKPVPLRKRMKVLRAVRGFNMLIMVIWAIYQCPSLPCPLLLQLADEGSTAFLGPTQCVWLEAHPSQSSYGAGVMRGVSIALQSVGLRKVANTIFFDWLNVLNIAMFFSASLLAMICSRWERQLAAQLEEDALELQQRSGFYVQHVARWRSLELQQVATKHWVLREKLRDLIEHLNNLRAFWANQGRGKPLTKEESRRRARVLDLCLRTGAPPSEIEPVLGQFVEAAGVEDETGMDDVTYEVLQNCVIQLMRARELQVLQRIADAEVRAREDELMEKCRALKPAEEESEPQETEAVAGSTKDAQAEAELPAEPEAAAQSGERSERRHHRAQWSTRRSWCSVRGPCWRRSSMICSFAAWATPRCRSTATRTAS